MDWRPLRERVVRVPGNGTSSPGRICSGALQHIDLSECSETEIPGGTTTREQALHLLARWLISAARKGAPSRADSPPFDQHNPLDVAAASKVVSKPG